MNTRLPPEPKKIELTLTVLNEAQARELDAAWREIVIGEKLERTHVLEQDLEAIQERARTALETIETAIRENPGTGQVRRLVTFLASLYNGYDYAFDWFDLTDLRAIDTKLANACLDVLNYDRLGKREIHHHLSGGAEALHRWISQYQVPPRIVLNEKDQHGARLRALAMTQDVHPNDLAREGLNIVLDKYEAREFDTLVWEHGSFGGGVGKTPPAPVRHARRRSQPEKPLCGELAGPWRVSAFRFAELTCERCRDLVLDVES
jgi:hypothetical protein